MSIATLFEGFSVTTVILAPGACGLGLRATRLATTSAAPAAQVAVFQMASFCAQASHLRALDPPRIGSKELGGYSEPVGAPRESLEELWEAPLSKANSRVAILAAENFGQAVLAEENLGRVILAAGKPWAGYFCSGNTWASVVWAAGKHMRAHFVNLPYRLSIFDT